MELSETITRMNGRQRKSAATTADATDREMLDEEEALVPDSDDGDRCPKEHRGIRGELGNVCLLLFLYVLQGIPLGLAGSIPLIMQSKNVSYKDQAFFSFVFWPFSLKLLWAPLVDSLYIKRFGRRKSWLVPTQYLLGFFMLGLSFIVESLLQSNGPRGPDVITLTVIFFLLAFLAATQDIAVDGWALTMLSRENVGYASTCNSVGQTAGYFLGNVLFLALESADFCNKYLRFKPQDQGIVTLSGEGGVSSVALDEGGVVSVGLDGGGVVSVGLDRGSVVSVGLDGGGEVSVGLDVGGVVSVGLDGGSVVSVGLDVGGVVSVGLDGGSVVSVGLDGGSVVSVGLDGGSVVSVCLDGGGVVSVGLDGGGVVSVGLDGGSVVSVDFLFFWGIVFLVSTTLVAVLKSENSRQQRSRRRPKEETQGVVETYKLLFSIIKLPAVFTFCCLLLTSKMGFSAADAVTGLKMVEAGVPKAELALLAVPMVPLQILLPLIISKYTAGSRPLDIFYKAFPFRLLIGLEYALLVWWTPSVKQEDGFPVYYYAVVLLSYALHQVALYSMFVACMAFHAKVSDPVIGGTYMTLLNTVTNLGGNWPSTLALWLVDPLTSKLCQGAEGQTCGSAEEAALCVKEGGVCVTALDGYYVESLVCVLIGLAWWVFFGKKMKRLQEESPEAWQCRIRK
ncbi:acetyl-coenzyme A transporter 1 [Silurus meridionalis]|nr:acetyl-coenzyme A transporter 1 [Silurus meridionalis]